MTRVRYAEAFDRCRFGGFSRHLSDLRRACEMRGRLQKLHICHEEKEAIAHGHSKASVDKFFASVRLDKATLRADRSQGIFQRPFIDFSRRLISQNRMSRGKSMLKKHASVFQTMKSTYGVSPGVLTAFWAFETDFGAVQGDFNTLNSLMTLSHDCRRPELFQPQVFAAT